MPFPSCEVAASTELGVPGYTFADLHDPNRLASLYERFCEDVQAANPRLWAEWDAYRRTPDAVRVPETRSRLLVKMAPYVSRFLARLFQIGPESAAVRRATSDQDDLFRFKIEFVRRRAWPLARASAPEACTPDDDEVVDRMTAGASAHDRELAIARAGCALLDQEKALGVAVAKDGAGATLVIHTIEALKQMVCRSGPPPRLSRLGHLSRARPLDCWHLVDVERAESLLPEALRGPDSRRRRRDGFSLTDARMAPREVLSEIHYCVLCHARDKDSCSKGLRNKDRAVSVNPLGVELHGCPLGEKISEMHMLRKSGDAVGALAIVIVDNPMCPGTGHRICNDCMKSCIYQKQAPVDIPQIETGVLTDVLAMPWGVEIFGLLTRWNPLNVRRPYALPLNGKHILVVGLGPAGYTLAHYLVNEGFGVIAIDGLKIEPLPAAIVGTDTEASRPIRDWREIYRGLDERMLDGFGGVSEYGITVRWDKNFLTLLHLTLARRRGLRIYGGIRFGGTMTIADAWALGFDHVAIAAGAGRPTIIDIKNNLIRGIRKASDFLMALQLTGAFKRDGLANLQVRLPAIVIGGGLTAIDTATELMAYYPRQVEKTVTRYERLVDRLGEAPVRCRYDAEELEVLDEFVAHGRAIRAERARAGQAGEPPDFVALVRSWGGVTVAYRKRLVDAPAYRLNHEEVTKALEEGITFAETLNPVEAVPDERGAVRALIFTREGGADTPGTATLPARTVLVAAGTTPTITYEREYAGTFQLDAKRKFFQPHAAVRDGDDRARLVADANGFFTSYKCDGRFVSYYGDNHPRYAGNVVKAMASAKEGFPQIVRLFARELASLDPAGQPERAAQWGRLCRQLDVELTARVERVVRLTPSIVEVIVKAPAAARHFSPGQFYRLQNYESVAPRVEHGVDGHGVPLLMEGLALTGAWVDTARGLISLIALELGVSSRLVAYLKQGEPVVLMGPTGAPTEIPERQRVLLLGGGLGNAVLFSIAKALHERGNRVLYVAGYKRGEDLFKREEIEAATDQVVWSTDTGASIVPARPQDAHYRGNIVQALLAYQGGELGERLVPLPTVDRIIAIASDRMMAAVTAARHGVLAPYLKNDHVGIVSINSPMQCMMKEVCAQCLQRQIDPATGQSTVVFSCFNQDQAMDRVDFPNLAGRLRQNTVQEKLADMWLDLLLAGQNLPHV